MKRGFTLIELVAVLGVFAVLMLAGTEILISVMKSSNQATYDNEIRQNASFMMQNISAEIYNSSQFVYSYDSVTKTATFDIDSGRVIYIQDSTGRVTKNGNQISSGMVAVCIPAGGSCKATTCANPGLVVTCAAGVFPDCNSVNISLTVQQRLGVSRSDFCSKLTLKDAITPRKY